MKVNLVESPDPKSGKINGDFHIKCSIHEMVAVMATLMNGIRHYDTMEETHQRLDMVIAADKLPDGLEKDMKSVPCGSLILDARNLMRSTDAFKETVKEMGFESTELFVLNDKNGPKILQEMSAQDKIDITLRDAEEIWKRMDEGDKVKLGVRYAMQQSKKEDK